MPDPHLANATGVTPDYADGVGADTAASSARTTSTAPQGARALTQRSSSHGSGLGPTSTSHARPYGGLRVSLKTRTGLCLLVGLSAYVLAAPESQQLWRGLPLLAPGGRGPTLLACGLLTGLWCTLPIHQRALASLRERRLRAAIPASLSVLVSLLLCALPSFLVRDEWLRGLPALHFLVVSQTLSLFALERALGLRARTAAQRLVRVRPSRAHRLDVENVSEHDVDASELERGDQVRVGAREPIPVDGVVLTGRSSVSEQRLTGEALPVDKRAGSLLLGGTLNGRGALTMLVKHDLAHSVVSEIARHVRGYESTEARILTRARRWAARFFWLTLASALLAFVLRFSAVPEATLCELLLAPLAVLLAATPCALAFTTRLTLRFGLLRAARAGVLVNRADAFEKLANIDTIVTDKTATLTEGRARVISVVSAELHGEPELLALASGLLSQSHHPLARAVATRGETMSVVEAEVSELDSLPGLGVVGVVDGARCGVGSHRLLQKLEARDVTLEAKAEALEDHGQTVLYVLRGARLLGLLGVADPLKLTSKDAVRELDERGVRVVLCTADAERSARFTAAQLGMRDVYAGRIPSEKGAVLDTLRAQGARIALATQSSHEAWGGAELRILMNLEPRAPDDARVASAPPTSERVTLVHGDIATLARAVRLSRLTVRAAKLSLIMGGVYHLCVVPWFVFGVSRDAAFGAVLLAMALGALAFAALCGPAVLVRLAKLEHRAG